MSNWPWISDQVSADVAGAAIWQPIPEPGIPPWQLKLSVALSSPVVGLITFDVTEKSSSSLYACPGLVTRIEYALTWPLQWKL